VAELSARWLSQALGSSVERFAVEDAHDGTTGRAVIRLHGAPDLPPRLFIKWPPADEAQRAFVTGNGMGRREALFYQSLAAELPLRTPHCYYAEANTEGSAYIMLLEHLEDSGCEFRNASRGDKHAWVKAVLSSFAYLHAHAWNSPRFQDDLAWLQPPPQHPLGAKLIHRALRDIAPQMPPIFSELAELYLQHTDAIHALWQSGPCTIIHGDVHDGNLFSDGGRPGFLDWALVARAPAMRDVGYFLAGTLAPELQHTEAAALLAHYAAELSALGVTPPSSESLWQQYQWHAIYVWMAATCTLAMGDAWQASNYVNRSLQRLHQTLEIIAAPRALRAAL
jgi:hypothetical protein